MLLGTLASFVAGKIGMTDAATLTKIKGYATQRYAQIYAGALWKDALSIYSLSVAAAQSTVILPSHVAHFLGAKFDRTGLIPIDQAFLFASNPELWDDAGTPSHCSELAAVATKIMPATAGETIQLRSTNAGDTSAVTLHGEDGNGDPVQEQVTLAGTGAANSTQTYAILYGFSKAATIGTVTAYKTAGIVPIQSLGPTENQRLHRRLRLHLIPGVALTLLVLAKRHAGPFTNDNDATALPSLCDQALQAMVHGDALEWQRQYGKAQGKFAEAIALQTEAKRTETYQAAQNARMTPGESLGEGCSAYELM